jgi:hypothetical protein
MEFSQAKVTIAKLMVKLWPHKFKILRLRVFIILVPISDFKLSIRFFGTCIDATISVVV